MEGAGHYLAKAVTIATRYNAVRRQFGGKDGLETQVSFGSAVRWPVVAGSVFA